jgi:hypothetical protein
MLAPRTELVHNFAMESESVASSERLGLAAFLTILRVRLAALVLLSAGTLLGRALGSAALLKGALPIWSALGTALGILSCWALSRHLSSVRAGRGIGWLAWALFALATLFDAYALAILLGVTGPQQVAGATLSVVRAVGLAELLAFAALAPVAASHARVAALVGAQDIEQRAQRAMRYVTLVALVVAGVAVGIALEKPAHEAVVLGAAGVSIVVVILALAKVLGVTRFLLAYLGTMGQPDSSTSIELRAWHRA